MSQATVIKSRETLIAFFVLHVLVYPSSNGYNSYMDKDTGPVGGIAHPLMPTRQLFYTTIVMDLLALALSMLAGKEFFGGVLLYILASRAYSYRGIRLKRFPVMGFFTVFLCQGALVFWMVYRACGGIESFPFIPMLASGFLIGSYYPLTQVYQHEQDAADGVTTISMLLGKRGSFLFAAFMFAMAAGSLALLYQRQQTFGLFWLFLLIMLPVLVFFLHWMQRVWKDERAADFRNSYLMNIVASACSIAYFLTIICIKLF